MPSALPLPGPMSGLELRGRLGPGRISARQQEVRRMPGRLVAIHLGIGALVTLHWVTFYGSIKMSKSRFSLLKPDITTPFPSPGKTSCLASP